MRHIVVTGGYGFIGSNFVNQFLEKHKEAVITVIDNFSYGSNTKNINAKYNNRINKVILDIADHTKMDRLFKILTANGSYYSLKSLYNLGVTTAINTHFFVQRYGPIEKVINFAAESHVDRSIYDPSNFVKTNATGVAVLCEAILKYDKGIRLVQVSTDEVYGSLTASEAPSVETDTIKPSSMYSASKAAGDMYALSYAHTHNLDVVVTRCSNNYGMNQYEEKLIPKVIYNMCADIKVPLYGDGMQIRDWIDVNDHCKGIYAALTKGKGGNVYNLGGNNQTVNKDVVKYIAEALGKDFEDCINHVEDRKGHDTRYAIDFSKAKDELEWEPETESFEAQLKKYVKLYLSSNEITFNSRYKVVK